MVYMKYNRCVTVVTAMAIALVASAYLYLSTIIPMALRVSSSSISARFIDDRMSLPFSAMRRPYSACDTASS